MHRPNHRGGQTARGEALGDGDEISDIAAQTAVVPRHKQAEQTTAAQGSKPGFGKTCLGVNGTGLVDEDGQDRVHGCQEIGTFGHGSRFLGATMAEWGAAQFQAGCLHRGAAAQDDLGGYRAA
ncbi:hypothetical protein GCM10010341_87620 [Streptomyces noursei]|nr:hypothetical protein GCM10010341_87620 [Streptomyces noursei]